MATELVYCFLFSNSKHGFPTKRWLLTVFQLKHNFQNVHLIASRLSGSVTVKNLILLISWFRGLGNMFNLISAHCAEKMAWLQGLSLPGQFLPEIVSLYWIWTPSKKGTRIMSADYTGQSLVIGAPVGVYLVWLTRFLFHHNGQRTTRDHQQCERQQSCGRCCLPQNPHVDRMHSRAKDLRACGSLWEILLRPLLPTGLLLSRLSAQKSSTLLLKSPCPVQFRMRQVSPTYHICGWEVHFAVSKGQHRSSTVAGSETLIVSRFIRLAQQVDDLTSSCSQQSLPALQYPQRTQGLRMGTRTDVTWFLTGGPSGASTFI